MSALGQAPAILTPLLRMQGIVRPPYNLIISNVPGPRTAHYWNGAKMVGTYPLSIPINGMALNITCTSYDGNMAFGLTGCRRTVPHLQRLLTYLDDEVDGAGEGRRRLSGAGGDGPHGPWLTASSRARILGEQGGSHDRRRPSTEPPLRPRRRPRRQRPRQRRRVVRPATAALGDPRSPRPGPRVLPEHPRRSPGRPRAKGSKARSQLLTWAWGVDATGSRRAAAAEAARARRRLGR